MSHSTRYTMEEALRKIMDDEIEINEEYEHEEYAENDDSIEDEPGGDRNDEVVEMDGQLPIFVEGDTSDEEELENEENNQIFEAGDICFIDQSFPERRWFQNVVIGRSRTLANPGIELFFSDDIIRTV